MTFLTIAHLRGFRMRSDQEGQANALRTAAKTINKACSASSGHPANLQKLLDFRFLPGQFSQFDLLVRVWQAAHVIDDIGINRNTVFETKGGE